MNVKRWWLCCIHASSRGQRRRKTEGDVRRRTKSECGLQLHKNSMYNTATTVLYIIICCLYRYDNGVVFVCCCCNVSLCTVNQPLHVCLLHCAIATSQSIVIGPVCVWVCLWVGGSATTITRNCVHRSSPNWVCR